MSKKSYSCLPLEVGQGMRNETGKTFVHAFC
jgi:hypothetical protein